MGSLSIKDSKLNTANSVVTSNVTDAAITPPKWTNPYKFSVYRSAALNSTNTDAAVVFDTELFDSNGNYDTSNGRYTAPVAGFYFFAASAGNSAATSTLMRTSLAVNGTIKLIGNVATPDTAANLFHVSGLIQLAASDYVQAFFVGGSGSTMYVGANQCWFNGFLVTTT